MIKAGMLQDAVVICHVRKVLAYISDAGVIAEKSIKAEEAQTFSALMAPWNKKSEKIICHKNFTLWINPIIPKELHIHTTLLVDSSIERKCKAEYIRLAEKKDYAAILKQWEEK